eukprot:1750441-Rhodomonas_salina.2
MGRPGQGDRLRRGCQRPRALATAVVRDRERSAHGGAADRRARAWARSAPGCAPVAARQDRHSHPRSSCCSGVEPERPSRGRRAVGAGGVCGGVGFGAAAGAAAGRSSRLCRRECGVLSPRALSRRALAAQSGQCVLSACATMSCADAVGTVAELSAPLPAPLHPLPRAWQPPVPSLGRERAERARASGAAQRRCPCQH